jgi:hypothetical protein
MHSPGELPHHLVQAHKGQFSYPGSQVSDTLKKLTNNICQGIVVDELEMELDYGSKLVDRFELDGPIIVFYVD